MSVEALAIALHHSRAKGIVKLVLIGIANHDGDGGSWPAVRTLARYAGCDPRSVRRAVEQLEKLGEVRRSIMGGGNRATADHLRPNLYHFTLTCPPGCDRSKNHKMPKEVIAVELVEEEPNPGTHGSGGDLEVRGLRTPVSSEPSLNQINHLKEEVLVDARETPADAASRYEVAIASKCPGWARGRHDYNPSGYCNFCGSHRDQVLTLNPTTGELT